MRFVQIIKRLLDFPYFLIIPGETISLFPFLFHLPIPVFIMHDNRILNCVYRNRKAFIIYYFHFFFKSIICFYTSPRFIISILRNTHAFGNNVCASTSEIRNLFQHCSYISCQHHSVDEKYPIVAYHPAASGLSETATDYCSVVTIWSGHPSFSMRCMSPTMTAHCFSVGILDGIDAAT